MWQQVGGRFPKFTSGNAHQLKLLLFPGLVVASCRTTLNITGRSFLACISKLYEWRITLIRATPAAFIGYVQAPDADQAIKEAIAKYEISNLVQARLAAQRVKEIS